MQHHYETNDAWHDKRRVWAAGDGNKEQVITKLKGIGNGMTRPQKDTVYTDVLFTHRFDMQGRISDMSGRSFRRIGNSEREWGWIMDDTANTSETTTIFVRDFLPNKLNLSPFGAWQTNRLLWVGSRGVAGGRDSGLDLSLNIKCMARCGEKIIRSQAALLYSHVSLRVYRAVRRCLATADPLLCIITTSKLRFQATSGIKVAPILISRIS